MGEYSDKAEGLGNEAMGNIKQDIGDATDNRQMEQEGFAQERKGEMQQKVCEAKGAIKDAVDKL
ncbi:MAG: CsbD family protein [Pseudomonadota bacterium]